MSHSRLSLLLLAACLLAACAWPLWADAPASAQEPAQATASPSAVPSATPAPPSPTPSPMASPTPTVASTATAPATAPPSAEDEDRPILVLMGSATDPAKPTAGGTFHLDLYLANEGEADAHDVQLTLGSDTFVARLGGSVLYADRIRDGDEATLSVNLTVADSATPGVHALAIAMRYTDRDGRAYTDAATLGIEVAASAQQPVVVVRGVRMPSRVAPGIPFTLGLDLANTGSQPATNVTVAPAAGPLALQGGGGAGPVDIPAGGLASLALRLVAASPQAPGAASQTLDLRYNGPTGQAYSASHVVGLVITGGAASDPLPMITRYTAGAGPSLHPGEVFELLMEITNVGVADALRTFLALGGGTAPASTSASGTGATGGTGGALLGVFAPLDTSNLRYLGRLAAGASTTVTQRLVVDGAAKPGPYVLEVNLSYVDADGQALAHDEVISLVVTRPMDLALTATNPVSETVAGEALSYPVELLNRGSNTVTVTELALEGPEGVTIRDGRRYVGELDSGASDTLEAEVTASKAGELVLTATARYLDDLRNEQAFTRQFTLTVRAAPRAPEPADGSTDAGDGGPGNLFLRLLKGFLGLGASPPVEVTSSEGTAEPARALPAKRGSGGAAEPAVAPAEPARR